MIETYGAMVIAVTAEAEREERAKHTIRVPVAVRSETADYQPMKVRPGKVFKLLVGARYQSFRPEDLAIHGDRARWIVHDFRIGNRRQFGLSSRVGPVPGTEFGPGGSCAHLVLETCHTTMDLMIEIEYVGPEADGEVFEATLVGTATDHH